MERKMADQLNYNVSLSATSYEGDAISDFINVKFLKFRVDANQNVFSLRKRISRIKYKDTQSVFNRLDDIFKNRYRLRVYHTDLDNCSIIDEENNILCHLIFQSDKITIKAFASLEDINLIDSTFREIKESKKVTWCYYDSKNRMIETEVDISFDYSIEDEYYPYIESGVNSFLTEYIDNSSPILILMGEPGTGKTSFVRNFIEKHDMNTLVTYDERIMNLDQFYIDFLTNVKQNLLVIEDADILLTSREEDRNRVMSKLLNLSDGIIKLASKKIIFTTNVININRIDEALIRPGRCFDVINFRKLNLREANKVSELNKLPAFNVDREYSLSEIFNRHERSAKIQKLGFKRGK